MPNYPPLIELDEDIETELKIYLDHLLLQHDEERGQFLDDIISYQRDYWAKPSTDKVTFPFTNAANIIIPLTAIAFEAIHARNMQRAFALDEIVAGRPINPLWADTADPFLRYFNHELKHSSNFKESIEHSIIEIEKLGTGVGYSHYEHLIKYGIREVGGREEEFPVTVSKGARFCPTPLSRFLIPFNSNNVEYATWVGEQHSKSLYNCSILEQSGFFYPGTYEALKIYNTWVGTQGGLEYERKQQELEKRAPANTGDPTLQNVEWAEMWLAFDINKSGTQKEIVVHYHREARVLMAVRHNWYNDLRRKYRLGVYVPVEHRPYGIGIAKQNAQFQKEITIQHRQRLDNATLANMRMIKISKMSGYGAKEPVFPGKMWFLDDIDQIDTFQLGEVYPSSYNNEQQSLIYSQQITTVNEATLGMPQAGTPGTATEGLARLQEGSKKTDYLYGNIESFMSKILIDMACDLQQFGPTSVEYFNNIEGGDLAALTFTLPQELIRNGLIIELATAGRHENKLLDRNNWTEIANKLITYFTMVQQIAMTMGNPQLMQLVSMKALGAATEATKQFLQTFNVRNVDKLIIPELLNAGIQQPTGPTGITPPSENGAVPDIASLFAALAGRGAQQPAQLPNVQ